MGVTVNYPYVYVSANFGDDAGFHVVDVSDPRNPKRASYLPNDALPFGIPREHTSKGAISYVTNEAGVIIIDATDPANPVVAGFAPGGALAVAVRDNLAYVVFQDGGLLIFDVSDPHAPALLGADTKPYFAQDIALTGNYALVAASDGLYTVDVSDPAHPHTVASGGSGGRGISVDGTRAYLGTSGAGIQMLDLANPASPTVLSAYRTPGYARKGVVQDGRLWIADAEMGLWGVPLTSFSKSQAAEPIPASTAVRMPAPMHVPMHHPQSRAKIPVLSRPRLAAAKAVRRVDQAAGSCVVSTTLDSGQGSLRECLTTAGPGDTITFDTKTFPLGDTFSHSIGVATELPPITQGNLTIDASNAAVAIWFGSCGSGVMPTGDANGLVVLSDGNRIQGLEFT